MSSSLIDEAHLSGPSSPKSSRPHARWHCRLNSRRCATHLSPPLHREDARVCACHLESLRQLWCAMVSHHCCPPASALVGDEVLEQAAPLAKLPLPNACRGGHHLGLLTRARSHIDRVRWHSPSCHVAHLGSDAPSTSPPLAAKGQRHARIAST
jgi:hypothetical protein